MEQIISIILLVFLYFSLAMLVLYLPRICYYFFAFKKQDKLNNSKKNRIAVIIPARNESTVIGHCLDTLAKQTYDSNYFDIHIVVADKKDPTIEIAYLYERTHITIINEQTCKGDALDGVLKKILADDPDKYDAFLIVDADNLAAKDLLEEMNNALASGKQIICGKKLIKNWQSRRRDSRSLVSNCTALVWTMVDELGNRARNAFGMTITMVGTGMMVRADVIKQNDGWPYRGLTEDYEMAMDAVLKDWSSMYYSHAKVYTEEAIDEKTASKRKLRWISGHVEAKRKYGKKIRKKILSKETTFKNIGFLIGTYPVAIFFGVSMVIIMGGLALLGFWAGGFGSYDVNLMFLILRLVWIPLVLVYGALFLYTLIILIADWKNMKVPLYEKFAVLFFHPLYAVSYFPVYIIANLKKSDSVKWAATDRIEFEAD